MQLLLAAAALAGPLVQDAFPPDRFGAYLETIDGLRGPVDALALPDGSLLVVERDADRLTRIAPDGARKGFGPEDLDAPEDVAMLPDSHGGGFAVCDTGNDRVVLLDADGAVRGVVGGRGDGPNELRTPAGVAAFAGDLYVADAGNGRVQAFEIESLELLHSFRDLARPVAVELAPDGRVLVLDSGTHQVVVFADIQPRDGEWANNGRRLSAFGDFGPHAGFLGHPRDLAIDETGGGRVYVADADNHRVQVFDLDGDYVYEWGKHALRPREGEGSLHYPSGVTLVGEGEDARMLVCEAFGDRIQIFGRTEEDPANFMTEPGLIPWKVSPHYGPSISTAGDLLAIYEPETQTVLVHDLKLDEPVEVNRFGAYGALPGQHREIADLKVVPPGLIQGVVEGWSVLVCDAAAPGTVSWWALEHEPDAPLRMDPRMASFALTLHAGSAGSPVALECAWGGSRAVADAVTGRVYTTAHDVQVGRGTFDEPVDLEFDGELLWIVDRGARAVVALANGFDEEYRGRETEVHRLDGFRRPRGVAVADDGEVYVTDEVAHVVRVFGPDESGAYVERRSFGGEGLGPGELYRPAGIAIDERDRVIVLDHGNHRGMIFDRAGEFLLAFGPRGYVKPTRK